MAVACNSRTQGRQAGCFLANQGLIVRLYQKNNTKETNKKKKDLF